MCVSKQLLDDQTAKAVTNKYKRTVTNASGLETCKESRGTVC